ncbi:MAG: DedA family protein [Lysobacterales bacterium]|nr:MAG: DedA family protein [Xanthomonadales bacterium]
MTVMTELIGSLGYLAVFVGALLEGEVTLLAAGFAAQQGLLDLSLVIGAGTFGASLGDQSWFLMGRWRGRALLARFPGLAAHGARLRAVLNRHPAAAIVLVRFIYGLRSAGAVTMGATDIRVAKFAALNMLGAAVWAALVSGGGYSFGSAGERLLLDVRQLQAVLLTTLAVAALSYWLRRRARSELPQQPDVAGDADACALGRSERR